MLEHSLNFQSALLCRVFVNGVTFYVVLYFLLVHPLDYFTVCHKRAMSWKRIHDQLLLVRIIYKFYPLMASYF